jgi:hypothetical protein
MWAIITHLFALENVELSSCPHFTSAVSFASVGVNSRGCSTDHALGDWQSCTTVSVSTVRVAQAGNKGSSKLGRNGSSHSSASPSTYSQLDSNKKLEEF